MSVEKLRQNDISLNNRRIGKIQIIAASQRTSSEKIATARKKFDLHNFLLQYVIKSNQHGRKKWHGLTPQI
jgi:hypothetical protein